LHVYGIVTVRILGDSSNLQRQLEDVLSQLDDFQSRLADVGDGGRALSEGLSRTDGAASALQQLSTLLGNVQQQEQQLSRQSISLNYSAGDRRFGAMSAAIQATAAQLAGLRATAAGGIAGDVAAPTRMAGIEALASGESGFSAASTELIAAPTTSVVGSTRSSTPSAGNVATTSNHFGGSRSTSANLAASTTSFATSGCTGRPCGFGGVTKRVGAAASGHTSRFWFTDAGRSAGFWIQTSSIGNRSMWVFRPAIWTGAH